ncbi:MAG: hypothetical protein Q8R35_02860 [bacterium]|nr:hypothetical protein [bacterium]
MEASELRKKSKDELLGLRRAGRIAREELELGIRQKKVKNVKELRGVKKDNARIEMLLHALRTRPSR